MNGFSPFWAFVWPGGYGLTRYIQDSPTLIRDIQTTVFDFGCGCGSASIAAYHAGASLVICNDIDPMAILATTINFHCNSNKHDSIGNFKIINLSNVLCTNKNCLSLTATEFNNMVREAEIVARNRESEHRVLLIGDMLYDEDIGYEVLKLVNSLLNNNLTVYVGDPGRDFARKHLPKYDTVKIAEYDLPEDIRSQNNGLMQVIVRKVISL